MIFQRQCNCFNQYNWLRFCRSFFKYRVKQTPLIEILSPLELKHRFFSIYKAKKWSKVRLFERFVCKYSSMSHLTYVLSHIQAVQNFATKFIPILTNLRSLDWLVTFFLMLNAPFLRYRVPLGAKIVQPLIINVPKRHLNVANLKIRYHHWI